MLKNLLGGKKKDDFYVQLDENQEAPEAEATEAETPVEVTAEAEAPVEEKTEETTSPKKKSAKAKSSTKGKATQTAPSTPKVPPAEVPFWVKAMRSTKEIETTTKGSGMTFSTDYLISNGTTSRRMPGPSLDPFKNMASQVKKPIR